MASTDFQVSYFATGTNIQKMALGKFKYSRFLIELDVVYGSIYLTKKGSNF